MDKWLWYLDIFGRPHVPLGFYDYPPDPDIPGVRGINVGGGRVQSLGRDLTRLVDEVNDFLTGLVP